MGNAPWPKHGVRDANNHLVPACWDAVPIWNLPRKASLPRVRNSHSRPTPCGVGASHDLFPMGQKIVEWAERTLYLEL